MQMNELLPCPFCGGEAETLTAESMHGGNLYGVMCANCAGRSDVCDTEAEAIAAWNSRIERTCENIDNDEDSYFRCSVCNISTLTEFMSGGYGLPNYCPNCGARVVE